jgi:hypothetical protein
MTETELDHNMAAAALELAKLAVALCKLNGGSNPKRYLVEALDLVRAAHETIEDKGR